MDIASASGTPHTENAVSIYHYDTIKARILPDLGHDVEDFQVFHWKIESWRALTSRMLSPEFEAGGLKWNILLYPRGNNQKDNSSIYLQLADPGTAEQGKYSCAQFALVMSNPLDPTQWEYHNAHHRFCAVESDWGFTRFYDINKVFQPNDGRSHPLIDGDKTVISAYVQVVKDPTGVLWDNDVSYDSKKATGFVGLINQGATGYLNAAVQCLYMIKYFRKAVYKIPTESDVPTRNVALALQRVFYNLQFSEVPVGTTELTKSLGGDSLKTIIKQDVQEFTRNLQDKLGSNMKNTPADGDMKKLFVGKMTSYVKSIIADYESSRVEDYFDILLDVKGCKNLHESFVKFVAQQFEKQHIEGRGLQKVKKGVYFESFPPVLYIQLNRYEYDISRGAMVKINDRHEYPFEIDLEGFLPLTADRRRLNKYLLHGVIVHSSNIHDGQYYALLKPGKDNKWFKYADDRVTPVTSREVFEDNYGGEAPNVNQLIALRPQMAAKKSFTSACVLVYIRESDVDEMLAPMSPGDIPPHIKSHPNEEKALLNRRMGKQKEMGLTVKIMTDETLKVHQGFDLIQSEIPSFRVTGEVLFTVFKQSVAAHFKVPVNRFRLWILVNRQNRTVRPDKPIPETDADLSMKAIQDEMGNHNTLRLYLEVADQPIDGKLWPPNVAFAISHLIIFLKYFDPKTQKVEGCGKLYVQRNKMVCDIIPILNEKKGFPSNTALKLYEEVHPNVIEAMITTATFKQSEIQDGDIICFQKEISYTEATKYRSQGYAATIIEFFGKLVEQ